MLSNSLKREHLDQDENNLVWQLCLKKNILHQCISGSLQTVKQTDL